MSTLGFAIVLVLLIAAFGFGYLFCYRNPPMSLLPKLNAKVEQLKAQAKAAADALINKIK